MQTRRPPPVSPRAAAGGPESNLRIVTDRRSEEDSGEEKKKNVLLPWRRRPARVQPRAVLTRPGSPDAPLLRFDLAGGGGRKKNP